MKAKCPPACEPKEKTRRHGRRAFLAVRHAQWVQACGPLIGSRPLPKTCHSLRVGCNSLEGRDIALGMVIVPAARLPLSSGRTMTKQSDSPASGRLLNPSNDTKRIAGSLGSHPACRARAIEDQTAGDRSPTLSVAVVEQAMHARALRSSYVPMELLGDPAWDMLLELLHGELTGRRITPAILHKAAGVRPATGQRWIAGLANAGLCIAAGPAAERTSITLSKRGSDAVRAYFTDAEQRLGLGD